MAEGHDKSAICDWVAPAVAAAATRYPLMPRQYSTLYADTFVGKKTENPFIVRQEIALGFPLDGAPAALDTALDGLMSSFVQANEWCALIFLDSGVVSHLKTSPVAPVEIRGGDGEPFFSPRRGNAPEAPTSLDTGLLSAFIKVREMGGIAQKLLVPPELEPWAIRLVDGHYVALDSLVSEERWFLLTNILGFERRVVVPFEISAKVTAEGDGVLIEARETVEWICHDPRAIWSSGHT